MPTVISSTVTVTTTATQLVAATANATRTIVIEPDDVDIDIGGFNVTASNGLTVVKSSQFQFVLPPHNALYAITGSGSRTVRLLLPEGDF